MGILNALIGNASEVKVERITADLEPILISGEDVHKAFQLVRDLYIFTNKRLIIIDKQGVSGKKTEYHSIPYASISHFSVETAGHFDLDSDLKIWVKGLRDPITQPIRGRDNVLGLQKILAEFVLVKR